LSRPASIGEEGDSLAISRSVTDRAGNTASATLTLKIDRTPPVVEAAKDPPGPWANAAVQVTFQCTDGLSGVESCPTPQEITAEGADQAIAGQALDRAGNAATASATVNIDRTAPTIAARVSPPANPQGWHRSDPTVAFDCGDTLSGIASCPESQAVTVEGSAQTVSGEARDAAGNTAVASVTVKLDKTPPAVGITSPADGAHTRTSPVSVAGSSSDALAGIVSVTCNGQPATVTGSVYACSAALAAGAQPLTVAAEDAAGNVGTRAIGVTYDANGAPTARPGGPYQGETDKPVAFSGGASSDPEGQVLTYAWDFGDGATAGGVSPGHAYAAPGTFTVRLTVTDPDGGRHDASTTATIVRANRPPVAQAGGPYSADAGKPVSFDGSASTDPDGDVIAYEWAFGDGGTGSGQRPRRTYLTPGSFTAVLTVTDGRGGSASAEAQVQIRAPNQAPTAQPGGPYSGTAAQVVSLSGEGSHDPDDDPLTYAWNFGDGATSAGPTPSHAYGAAGTYNVSLTVTDGRGGSHTAGTTAAIAPANAAPVAHAGGPYSGTVGSPIAVDGSESSDPDSDSLTYAWTFGDGRSTTGATANHSYDIAGTYTATLRVEDGRGGSASATANVTVSERTAESNHDPVAQAGGPYSGEAGIPISFTSAGSSDPDGDALTFAWTFGDGGTGSGPSPAHAYAEAQPYTAQLTVTDGHGGSATASAAVTVLPPADRAPPVIELTGPRQVLPGTQVIVTALAADNVGVASVGFDVQEAAASTDTTAPYERAVDVPSVAAPGDTIAGHGHGARCRGQRGVGLAHDDDRGPAGYHAPAGQPHRAADDGRGFDAERLRGRDRRFRGGRRDLPAGRGLRTRGQRALRGDVRRPRRTRAVGSTLTIVAEAVDFAGNHGAAEAAVTVIGTPDVTPPTVTLSAPAAVRAGETFTFSAQASDAGAWPTSPSSRMASSWPASSRRRTRRRITCPARRRPACPSRSRRAPRTSPGCRLPMPEARPSSTRRREKAS
jgi:PKD repeat protein